MLDYDKEAAVYDATRGGIPRARSAAEAVLGLVPPTARTLLDLACGTGLVTMRLTRPGLRSVGIDLAAGMLRAAAPRLDGAAVRGDSRQLPFRSASVDVVTVIWLLHLLPDARPVIAEAARVLRPGGVLVTTVDKAAAHDVGSDIDTLVAPYRGRLPSDAAARVAAHAAAHGLRPSGEARFPGHGQGRTPRRLADDVRRGRIYAAGGTALADLISALPDPELPRADPEFTVHAFTRHA
ncbi:methyltransferase domain-containing protein [Streptomyces sp. NPDC051956]|uniref:class I SAM-dependent methyltransferase n=1 Tax=Streptomyces sp. NPDC051956 TaxID=3365677 RepID=UPI0037D108BC